MSEHITHIAVYEDLARIALSIMRSHPATRNMMSQCPSLCST